MITSNIDVEDGLVNGACGTLKFITFEPNSTQPNKLWLDFNSQFLGNKATLSFLEYMKSTNRK